MASQIDPTFPPDNQRVEKSQMRQQLAYAKQEIEKLQKQTALPWLLALGIQTL